MPFREPYLLKKNIRRGHTLEFSETCIDGINGMNEEGSIQGRSPHPPYPHILTRMAGNGYSVSELHTSQHQAASGSPCDGCASGLRIDPPIEQHGNTHFNTRRFGKDDETKHGDVPSRTKSRPEL